MSERCIHGYPVRDDDPTVQECIDRHSESDAAFICPRGHRHVEGSAFCTVCGAGPVVNGQGDSSHAAKWQRARRAANEGSFGPDSIAAYRLLGADMLILLATLEQIVERGPDESSVDGWAYFPAWAKGVAQEALDG